MKKQLLLALFIGLLFGCTGVKRGVQDDLFYSSNNPKLNILINQEFKYAESKKETDSGTNPGAGESMANVKLERYPFVNRSNNRQIVIDIQEITTRSWFWQPGHFRDTENKIESGNIVLNGKKYEYCVAIQELGSGTCLLSKILCRTVTANNNCRIFISYSQYIEGYSLCDGWKDNQLTESEKLFLNNLIADSEKDFTILDYQDPTSVTPNPE